MIKPVFLPKTDFSIKANLTSKEPLILKEWQEKQLYKVIRQKSKDLPKFILQDGPPFANGKPHMGTAFNRIIKDVILRFKQMQGYDAPFIPGWDCHGLPIEWKVCEDNKGKNLSIIELRRKCKEFALGWINIQREVFKRLGTIADWDSPYITMDKSSEYIIVSEILNLLKTGAIYKDARPVLWSVAEQTALAEAEVEYKDKESTSIYVAFKLKNIPEVLKKLHNPEIVIWTTTPWTIPANRAISYSSRFKYAAIRILETENEQLSDRIFIVAEELISSFLGALKSVSHEVLKTFEGNRLSGAIAFHPLHSFGYDFDVPLLDGNHVTVESGTGFVHTAPSHGLDDFYVSTANGIKAEDTVSPNGCYTDIIPLFKGIHIFNAEPQILKKLTGVNSLIAVNKITHSYPHSWRSKTPLIYRATSQWFISLDKTNIRAKALNAIDNVNWIPEKGKNRISSFVENRKDWCISRQRSWGIPLAFFVDKITKNPLIDEDVFAKTIEIIKEKGTDAWYENSNEDFLCNKYNPDQYEKVFDIIDVWIESGSVFSYVTKKREELSFPADLYLEGSDQHRGWFQSSLLVSVASTGIAPYKSVLTHGFIVDEKGMKMSKSIGNVVDPESIINDCGADILRIWAVNNDYTEDMRIGQNIIDQQKDLYRKLRNMFRYMLGALDGFDESEKVDYSDMTDLDKYILSKLYRLETFIKEKIEVFDIKTIFITLKNFCLKELSSFYFDIMKDCLYCDSNTSLKRRSYRTVLDILFKTLTKWYAPILVFTTEESWKIRYKESFSIHTELFENLPEYYFNKEIEEKFLSIIEIRSKVFELLESLRNQKIIGSNLEASITMTVPFAGLDQRILADILILSDLKFIDESETDNSFIDNGLFKVKASKFDGLKCVRCRKLFKSLENELCERCSSI